MHRIGMLLFLTAGASLMAAPPRVGDKAPDFALPSLRGELIRFSEMTAKSPVVLVVLRGFPGYQCPICSRQVQEFLRSAKGFADAGAQVVMIYPGPGQDLNSRAEEFTADKKFPDNFHLLLDSGYEFTNLYGLRWEAPKETAYPSTFLIDQRGVVFFAKISDSHGGRTTAAEVIDVLNKKGAGK
jgi:thioredoxin-dependent peroxiredoxin